MSSHELGGFPEGAIKVFGGKCLRPRSPVTGVDEEVSKQGRSYSCVDKIPSSKMSILSRSKNSRFIVAVLQYQVQTFSPLYELPSLLCNLSCYAD